MSIPINYSALCIVIWTVIQKCSIILFQDFILGIFIMIKIKRNYYKVIHCCSNCTRRFFNLYHCFIYRIKYNYNYNHNHRISINGGCWYKITDTIIAFICKHCQSHHSIVSQLKMMSMVVTIVIMPWDVQTFISLKAIGK